MEMTPSEAVAAKLVIPELVDAFSLGTVSVPALRERRDDIPALAHHFLQQFRHSLHAETLDIAPGAMQKLRDYQWPGNVRELRNVIERVLVLYGSRSKLRHRSCHKNSAGRTQPAEVESTTMQPFRPMRGS